LTVNEAQACHVAELVLSVLGAPEGKKVALLGLAFKATTDDLRNALSLKIAKQFMAAGACVSAFDPVVKEVGLAGFEALECADSIPACLADAHCYVVVTEWEQFKALTPDDFIEHMAQPAVVDARRIFDPRRFRGRIRYGAVSLGGDEADAADLDE
jgi:UDPglucose 6-dehydrogenase